MDASNDQVRFRVRVEGRAKIILSGDEAEPGDDAAATLKT